VTTRLLSEHNVLDLTVEDPPIDDVIELAFASANVVAGDGDR
jgi:ABC-2 type transport system ATP-binding protein